MFVRYLTKLEGIGRKEVDGVNYLIEYNDDKEGGEESSVECGYDSDKVVLLRLGELIGGGVELEEWHFVDVLAWSDSNSIEDRKE